jgi:hypothetical protein
MKWILLLFVILIVMLQSKYIIRPSVIPLGGGRGLNNPQMCHQMAYNNCRIPTVTLNDCWINNYQKCMENGGSFLKCSDQAHSECQSSDAPGKQCYEGIYKECMAGRSIYYDH